MTRRFGTGRLNKSKSVNEEINPMDGVANLADVMLVFACGLMLALIINWNLDVSNIGDGAVSIEQGEEITEYEGIADSEGESLDENASYEEMGKVYRDAATGKLYMVIEDE